MKQQYRVKHPFANKRLGDVVWLSEEDSLDYLLKNGFITPVETAVSVEIKQRQTRAGRGK